MGEVNARNIDQNSIERAAIVDCKPFDQPLGWRPKLEWIELALKELA